MPHIEQFKNNGIPYLRVCEGRYISELGRQKKIILKNLGPLSKYDDGKPDFLKRFREQFKNGEIEFEGLSYSKKTPAKNVFEFDNNYHYVELKNIGALFLNPLFNQLGISDILNQAKSDSKIKYDLLGMTKLYVFNRIMNPQSKLKAFKSRNEYFYPITFCENEKEIYKPLDILDEYSKKIQMRMNTKIKNSNIGRKTDLTYYDVTNYYFERMYGDDDIYEIGEDGKYLIDEETGEFIIKEIGLRKKGVSKENRTEPIVQMGLFLDNNGIPVSYNLFPGNTQDKTTFTNTIKTSINEFDLGRIVVVADNGMNTQENLSLLTDKGNGYIVSKSVKRCWKSYKSWVQDDKDYLKIKDKNGTVVFKYKSRIIERTLKYTDKFTGEKHSKKVKEKEIVYWSKKQYEKEINQNKKFLEYVDACKEHPEKLKDKQKLKKFIKVVKVDEETGEVIEGKDMVVLKEDKIQAYKDTMGYYMIITSEIEEKDRELINKYHGLSRIEDSFRIIKSDLEGRPVFVWTKEHINAHFLICFIALTMIRIIQYKILKYQNKSTLNVDGWEQGITAEKLKEALYNLRICADRNGTCMVSKPKKEIGNIVNALGIDIPDLTSSDRINKFKNMLNNIDFI